MAKIQEFVTSFLSVAFRYLASKCALAARIDAFSDEAEQPVAGTPRCHIFGDRLKEQLEERLR